jgi:hypothetical protein
MHKNQRQAILLMVLINLTFIMLWVSPVLAGESGRRQTFGNEPTGQAAITFFILANLTVVASILAARAAKSQGLTMELKGKIKSFNQWQRKHIRWSHYIFNPLAVLAAFLHWWLSQCWILSFQKWGLVLLALWAILGLTIKFKLAPQAWRPRLFKLHTRWVIPAAFFVVVLIGHALS